MCSGIRLIADDSSVLIGRTMEFGSNIEFQPVKTPEFIGMVADGYAVDGLNKYGLVVMAFYFPGYATYSPSTHSNKINLAAHEVTNYLLQNAMNCTDVVSLAEQIVVTSEKNEMYKMTFPLHWFVCDASGRTLVLECLLHGHLKAYENKLGIMANSPTFPEHLTSLQYYPSFTPYDQPDKPYSRGTGLLGLPGDFTSNSRFVRLNMFQQFVLKPKDGNEGVKTVFHILNNFDIPLGVVRSNQDLESTKYTIVYDIKKQKAYYKTYEDSQVKMLNHV